MEANQNMTQGADSLAKAEQHFRDVHDFRASWTINMENLIDQVIGTDALYASMNKCRKGVLWKDSVASFYLNGVERCIKLNEQLSDGTYKASPTVCFRISSPKPRDIASITFRDRVYQRSLNDNAVYPIMSRSFIYDNFACQKGKGTDAARNRLKQFLREYYRKHGNAGYVSQFDIHGYYPNMNHEMTEKNFKRKLPPEIYEMVVEILRKQYKRDKGYNPGSQLIQIAGISVLNGFDHFVKERLRVKYYIRYMDDFLMISNDLDYLTDCREKVKRYLSELGFELNEKKTMIYPIKDWVDFLGFEYRLTETGKVLMNVRPTNVKRERLKLRRLVGRSKKGLIPKRKVTESYMAWRNHASKGDFRLIERMDTYYKNLWEEKENGCINEKQNGFA